MTYFNEHPDIEFPQFLIDHGFQDNSWHNDISGRAALYLDRGADEIDYINVWCEHERREDREWHECTRYMVEIVVDEHLTSEMCLLTDDQAAVEQLIAQAVEAYQAKGHEGLVEVRAAYEVAQR